jgi:insertion element IS1 protein InsB
MTGYGGRLWRTYSVNTLATLERLPGLLSAFEVVVWMTDGWPLYESA